MRAGLAATLACFASTLLYCAGPDEGKAPRTEAIKAHFAKLVSEDKEVRREALLYFGKLDKTFAAEVPLFTASLKDERNQVRAISAYALGKIGEAAAGSIPEVEKLLALVEAAESKPNVVLLISDDDDYEHFGFMGSKIAQTPTLDKLAAAGTLFTTAHCPAPLCRPSLASMLSGRLPHQHGIYANYLDKKGIGRDLVKLAPAGSLANRLKNAGYATYATGKYWEGDPRTMGFTHGTVKVSFGGFSQFVRKGQNELFQFIDEQHESKPMFIWWAPLVPHSPHNPPAKYLDRFAEVDIPIPSFYKGDRRRYVIGMRKFYAMGTWFDDGVAQLIKKLKAAGEYENTLFLFYVDNGWAYGMPAKNSPSEKGLRTPMFVTWPGKVSAGKRIDSLNYALDLHATALDYAGVGVPADIASKSLRSQIDGKTSKPHDVLFGAVYAHAPQAWTGDPSVKRSAERDLLALYARTDQWKYVLHTQDINAGNAKYVWMIAPLSEPYYRQKGEQDLFDLHADPYERKNLAGQLPQKKRVAELRRQTLDWWKRTGGGPLAVAGQAPNPGKKKARNPGGRVLPAGRTTPESLELQQMLAQMRDAGCAACVMEVTHALSQHRVDAVDFTLGLINTPITDAGLKDLEKLQKLNGLALLGTKIIKEGVAELQKALPKCKIGDIGER